VRLMLGPCMYAFNVRSVYVCILCLLCYVCYVRSVYVCV